jgi:hypothetical protein
LYGSRMDYRGKAGLRLWDSYSHCSVYLHTGCLVHYAARKGNGLTLEMTSGSRWGGENVSRQSSIWRQLIDLIHCHPTRPGKRSFSLGRYTAVLEPHGANLHRVLAWHHLYLRSSQLLSLSIRGKDCRNSHLDALVRLLWHGYADSAISMSKGIPKEHLPPTHIYELVEHPACRKPQIPV